MRCRTAAIRRAIVGAGDMSDAAIARGTRRPGESLSASPSIIGGLRAGGVPRGPIFAAIPMPLIVCAPGRPPAPVMVNALLVNAPMVDALIQALAMIMVLAGVRGLRQSRSRRERGRYRRQLHYAYSSCSFARVLCHH